MLVWFGWAEGVWLAGLLTWSEEDGCSIVVDSGEVGRFSVIVDFERGGGILDGSRLRSRRRNSQYEECVKRSRRRGD